MQPPIIPPVGPPIVGVGFYEELRITSSMKKSPAVVFVLLPEGRAPTRSDRIVCVLFSGLESEAMPGKRHPLIESIVTTIQTYVREHPTEDLKFTVRPDDVA